MANLYFFMAGYLACVLTVFGIDVVYSVWRRRAYQKLKKASNLRNLQETMRITSEELEGSFNPTVRFKIVEGSAEL